MDESVAIRNVHRKDEFEISFLNPILDNSEEEMHIRGTQTEGVSPN